MAVIRRTGRILGYVLAGVAVYFLLKKSRGIGVPPTDESAPGADEEPWYVELARALGLTSEPGKELPAEDSTGKVETAQLYKPAPVLPVPMFPSELEKRERQSQYEEFIQRPYEGRDYRFDINQQQASIWRLRVGATSLNYGRNRKLIG